MSIDQMLPLLHKPDSDLYLHCRPISETVPKDIPQLMEIQEEYWSAKLIVVNENTKDTISAWFSIPYTNIQQVFSKNPHGSTLININSLDTEDKTVLFANTKPVFNISGDIDTQTARWLKNNVY